MWQDIERMIMATDDVSSVGLISIKSEHMTKDDYYYSLGSDGTSSPAHDDYDFSCHSSPGASRDFSHSTASSPDHSVCCILFTVYAAVLYIVQNMGSLCTYIQ